MSAKREIKEGSVFYPKGTGYRYSFRRVVGVVDDRVFYSVGDKILNCSRKAFLKATKKEEAA